MIRPAPTDVQRACVVLLLDRPDSLEHAFGQRNPATLRGVGLVDQEGLRPGDPAAGDRPVPGRGSVQIAQGACGPDRTRPVALGPVDSVGTLHLVDASEETPAARTTRPTNLRAPHPRLPRPGRLRTPTAPRPHHPPGVPRDPAQRRRAENRPCTNPPTTPIQLPGSHRRAPTVRNASRTTQHMCRAARAPTCSTL